ncbi:MAG TPA: M23 family metallopeptidase, partial [Gemmatimonadales bacterium]|nr:M23 family metallopeptidase [Gemmatimonadales bacterium]
LLATTLAASPLAAQKVPQLPDSTGWGTRVLTHVVAPDGARWVGTYGNGIFVLPRGAKAWRHIRSDTSATSLSWDFVHAIAFGPGGRVWYGTVGNGWGVSTDDGRTWRNWTLKQLGPEWQYVAPEGIVTRGDTTVIATADGLQVTTDHGATWTAIVDSTGPAAKGPAAAAEVLLADEYVTSLRHAPRGWIVGTPTGAVALAAVDGAWRRAPLAAADTARRPAPRLPSLSCGYAPGDATCPRLKGPASAAARPRAPLTTWFLRPIALAHNSYIDQTYRYGSTMGGNFQQHQGVEFNNGDGTPVRAIGGGVVAYAGRGEAGANVVAVLHDSVLVSGRDTARVFSVYYHNSSLAVSVGERVEPGQVVARVGNTGRATNDHLHLEVHVAPSADVRAVVDSLNKFPPHTTNPELWIRPLPGTGIVAGTVRDASGARVQRARIHGLWKAEPRETPLAFVETYADKAHPHPRYGEDFAIGDVPAGDYVLAVEIGGVTVRRRVTVEPLGVTWVEFVP